MKEPKYSQSFKIALSALSCAVAVIFLSLGLLSGYLTALGYLVGILALMAPLSKKFYLGGFLAYAGTCILAVALGAAAAFWDLVPFIMFFGLHPLVNALQLKFGINKWLAFAIKVLWFDGTLIAGYFLIYGGAIGWNFLPEAVSAVINRYIYLFVFTAGTAMFFVYDRLIFRCQRMVDAAVARIAK